MKKILLPDSKYIMESIIVSFLSALTLFSMVAGFVHFIAFIKDEGPVFYATTWMVAGICIIVTWIVSIPIIVLWIRNLKYIILEGRITVYKGILTKVEKNIPYRAVTDFILERSLFDRLFGIGTVKVQTAGQSPGSSGYEGKLSGLREYQTTHNELRDIIGKLHPGSISPDGSIQATDESVLKQILKELKEIRKNTE